MTADLLRRAATKLRDRANDCSTVAPWSAEVDEATGRAWMNLPCAEHAWGVHGFPAEAQYVELMHPPVALALADLLGDLAAFFERSPDLPGGPKLIALARAILREDA